MIDSIIQLIVYSFLFLLLFTIFIEMYIGSILIRPNSSGILEYNFLSLGSYCIHPLHNSFLWDKRILFCNFPLMFGLFLVLLTYFVYLQ